MTFLFTINKGSWAFDLCTVSLVRVSQTPEVSSDRLWCCVERGDSWALSQGQLLFLSHYP